MKTTDQTTDLVWSKVGPDGKVREIRHTSGAGDFLRFSALIDGVEVSNGPFQEIDRRPGSVYRQAPKGTTHHIGKFVVTAEDAAIIGPLVLELARRTGAELAAARAQKGQAVREQMAAAGFPWPEVEETLDHYGRDGYGLLRARVAEDVRAADLYTVFESVNK